jgi:hypothetical protein
MKRNANVWAKVLLGMIGVGAAIWIIIVSLGSAGTREWESYAASLRAKGQPLTFAEIEAQRAVIPEDKNSARVIEGLAATLDEQRGGAITLDSLGSGSNETGDFFTGLKRGRIERAREFLAKHQDILTKLEELRDKPTGRFLIQYDQKNPLGTLIPHVSHVRTASRLVRLDTKLRLVDADQAGALRGFELQCRLAGTFGDQPILISRLVQIAIEAQAIATAEDLLRSGTTDDPSLKRMAAELGAMKQTGTLKWGLLGERAFFVEACDALSAGRISLMDVAVSADGGTAPFLRLPAFLMRSNQLRGTQMHTSLIDAVDDPKALLAAARKIEQDVPNLSRMQMLVKILMPSLTRAVLLNTRISAQLDCAVSGLAAERFRLAEGRLPGTLDQLVPAYLPAVPIDPFDGKPLRLAQTQEGIVIYSVDENGVDDGGDIVTRKEGVRKTTPDMGFRLNGVDHRGVLLVDDPPRDED